MELYLVPALLFFIFAAWGCTLKPLLAVTFILCVSVVNAWFIEPPSFFMGLNIYLHDIVFFTLLICALYRIIVRQEFLYSSPLWICYGLIILYGLCTGLKQYGTLAGVDFRNFFYYWSGTFYFMSFAYSKEMIDKVAKYWLWICSALLLIVYFRFVADFLHLPIAATWIAADSTGVRFRVVSSSPAYLLSVALIFLFHRFVLPDAVKPSSILTVLFAIAIIVLQHRSVWAATLSGIATLFLLPGIKKHQIVGKLAGIGMAGAVLILPLLLLGYADSFINTISDSAERATNLHTGTFGGRMQAWDKIMRYWVKLDFLHQLLGEEFGGSYAGLLNTPHNFFFHSLLRTGILGNFLISFFYFGILLKFYFNLISDQSNRFYSSLFTMLLVAQMVFYIPYSIQPEHGILLGIAASLAKRKMVSENEKNNENAKYFIKNAKQARTVTSA